MSDTRVHYNSSKPAQLQAHAYAQGNQIHIAPGQDRHLAHEAWHVVQQKQGRVQPTRQLKGKAYINDDDTLEKEADRMVQQLTSRNKETSQTPIQKKAIPFAYGKTAQLIKLTDIKGRNRIKRENLWNYVKVKYKNIIQQRNITEADFFEERIPTIEYLKEKENSRYFPNEQNKSFDDRYPVSRVVESDNEVEEEVNEKPQCEARAHRILNQVNEWKEDGQPGLENVKPLLNEAWKDVTELSVMRGKLLEPIYTLLQSFKVKHPDTSVTKMVVASNDKKFSRKYSLPVQRAIKRAIKSLRNEILGKWMNNQNYGGNVKEKLEKILRNCTKEKVACRLGGYKCYIVTPSVLASKGGYTFKVAGLAWNKAQSTHSGIMKSVIDTQSNMGYGYWGGDGGVPSYNGYVHWRPNRNLNINVNIHLVKGGASIVAFTKHWDENSKKAIKKSIDNGHKQQSKRGQHQKCIKSGAKIYLDDEGFFAKKQ